jgi:transcriptional regulator with XRE-family HTH domain
MTRKQLGRRTGIPEPSLKDIESGKYKMTLEVIVRIAIATGVHPKSLADGKDPLLDHDGRPLSRNSRKYESLAESLVDNPTLAFLVSVSLDAAAEKGVSYLFQFLLHGWLVKTSELFELTESIRARLTANLGSFMPGGVPLHFQPQAGNAERLWRAFEAELQREVDAIEERRLASDPQKAKRRERWLNTPVPWKGREGIAFEAEYQRDMKASREEALARCRERRQASGRFSGMNSSWKN